ncbi:prolyl-tRNA synthetase associated domain-containing protein [uncultured Bartonella sp.]|uniref:prolyl-tRNA synthetase associated domain-containing protein n=1 Tax=uncultured Bartonella sp. TaxID=104108 RepID=UPI002625428C|nr:prolyl-tRNA synthetase associated domain-containing protein [uncultured Bartonella sp.]
MQAGKQQLLDFLESLNIKVKTVSHRAVFTVQEGEDIKKNIPGAHTKNLFLKDKKGHYFLVTLGAHAVLDLKHLHDKIGASGRLSFASAEKLSQYLGLYPGAVSAFGLINDKENQVTFILDKALYDNAIINCHPMTNEATTSISREDLVKFARATKHEPLIIQVSEEEG